MTCSRLNVVPKISSHSAGCTIRVTSSVRSRRSFCSSTIANALTRLKVAGRRCHPRGARVSVIVVGWSRYQPAWLATFLLERISRNNPEPSACVDKSDAV